MPKNSLEAEVADLSQSIGVLIRRIRAAAALHGLSWTESAVLARLSRDGAATTADLARAEGMRPQSMGTTVATLEEMRLVERKPHPTDGRQFLIALTAKGLAVRNNTRAAKRNWLAQMVAKLDEKERETLFAAGRILRRLVEENARD